MIGNCDIVMNFIKYFSFLHQYLQIQTVLAEAVEDHHFLGLFYESVLCLLTSLTEVHKSLKINQNFHKDVLILMSLSSPCFITAFLFNFSLLLLAYCTPSILTLPQ